jgi:alcohol dehydrogenase class IV
MNYAQILMPQTTVYGKGSLAALSELAPRLGSRALLISDRVMEKLGNVRQAVDLLQGSGISVATYLDVNAEPNDVHVAEALQVLREHESEFIVAIGGGSCIDAAKAVSVVGPNRIHIGDLIRPDQPIERPPLPVIAIPTTAGTGSEMTNVTVIINTATDVKMMIKRPELTPAIAIADPLLTLSVPPNVTAATGVDTLCHAIEAYLSRRAHPMTDHIALCAIKLATENLPIVFEDGGNVAAREAMMLAAMQGGIAFSNASVTLIHGMSRPIGALFHVPHGVSNAMLLPVVLTHSLQYASKRLAEIARFLHPGLASQPDEALADKFVGDMIQLCRQLKIPNPRNWGIDPDQFAQSTDKMATDALASGSPANHPYVPTHEEIRQLYMQAYDYQ